MNKDLSFVEQFNKGDNASNDAIIKLINELSTKQKKALFNMVNSKNKEIFDEMRKRGEIK